MLGSWYHDMTFETVYDGAARPVCVRLTGEPAEYAAFAEELLVAADPVLLRYEGDVVHLCLDNWTLRYQALSPEHQSEPGVVLCKLTAAARAGTEPVA